MKTFTDIEQQELLKNLNKFLLCDPEKGELRWKSYRGPNARQNDIAGTTNKQGIITIKLFGNKYQAQDLIWLFVHGKLPEVKLIHINNDKTNNSISN